MLRNRIDILSMHHLIMSDERTRFQRNVRTVTVSPAADRERDEAMAVNGGCLFKLLSHCSASGKLNKYSRVSLSSFEQGNSLLSFLRLIAEKQIGLQGI